MVSIDLYTEEQYNDCGWGRANDVLPAEEYKQFNSYYADHKIHKNYFVKTRFGESIIPVGKDSQYLVYAKGDINDPTISKVIEINESNNYLISQIGEDMLENERQGSNEPCRYVQIVFGEESITFHKRRDLPSFREFRRQREGIAGTENSSVNGTEQYRTGNVEQNNGDEQVLKNSSFPLSKNKDIAPMQEASSKDGVFFDAKNSGTTYPLPAHAAVAVLLPESEDLVLTIFPVCGILLSVAVGTDFTDPSTFFIGSISYKIFLPSTELAMCKIAFQMVLFLS